MNGSCTINPCAPAARLRTVVLQTVTALKPILSFLVLASGLFAQPAAVCHVTSAIYEGGKTVEMSNPWVKLELAPQLGGRLMQVTFGGQPNLFGLILRLNKGSAKDNKSFIALIDA